MRSNDMSDYSIKFKNLLTGEILTESPDYPLFNHESYKIQVSINEENYSSSYRKSARWDFGDGTVVEGTSAIHHYAAPGRYTISCTLYSLDKKIAENVIAPVQVIVKETIPTELSFINPNEWDNKEKVFCKNNNLGSLQITTGINIVSEPKISAHQRNVEGRHNYFDICEESNYHLQRYWTFLQEEMTYYYNGEYAKMMLRPTQTYSPEYIPLYGRFVGFNKTIKLEVFAIVPENDETYKKCKLSPYNTTDLRGTRISDFEIIRKDKLSQLPEGCTEIGKIAFVNIWYKSDFGSNCDLFFEIKKDTLQFDTHPMTAENYLNIPPLGLGFELKKIVTSNQCVECLTSNGIFGGSSRDVIDTHLAHNFYKNYKVEGYWATYVKNDDLYGEDSYNLVKYDEDNPLAYGIKETSNSDNTGCIVKLKNNNGFFQVYEFTPLKSNFVILRDDNVSEPIYTHGKLVDLNELTLPQEKMVNEDIDRLLSVYLQHPMYETADNAKKFLHDIFANKNILSYLTSKGTNFIDDNINHKTCYVDKLLSILEMLDRSTTRYDIAAFEKVNDLRDLTRILTMNYSHLFGTVLENEYDIEVTAASKGKNVGEKINADDTIFCNEDYEVIGFRKNSKIYQLATPTEYIIVKDNFTYKTRLASFYNVQSYEYEEFADQSEEWKLKNADFIAQVARSYHIVSYDQSWGWCLNLPDEMKHSLNRANQMDSYYNFFTFIPVTEKKRVSNFISEHTIPASEQNSEEQISVEEWNKDFGFTYDCLMKVLTQNLK